MHTGYVHLIGQAGHTLYIETQYFLGSSHFWTRQSGTRCGNLIPTEITPKICEKIRTWRAIYLLHCFIIVDIISIGVSLIVMIIPTKGKG
jgi:hypothetical protein